MAINKNALIRYKTIDNCLQNRFRKWTLEDLIDACSDALYEFEGIDGVSKRTVQADIQMMRSNKLGYNAPIIVLERKYYTYEDAEYSITNIPLSDQDLNKLGEAVAFLKQFQGFSHFDDLSGMVQKLEDQIYSQKTHTEPVIDFEKNENLKGLQHLDFLYQSIIQKKAIEVSYQSFKARKAASFIFHAYLLKEFNNRWFLIGRKNKGDAIMNLAIDRIISLKMSATEFKENKNFNAKTYYENAIGVSVSPGLKVEEVVFFVNHLHAPYVETKPLHKSQKTIEKNHFGYTFSMHVQHNFELEKKLLGFGDGLKVLQPERLRKNILSRIEGALDLYNLEISEENLKNKFKKYEYKGYNIYNQVFPKRNIGKLEALIQKHKKEHNLVQEKQIVIENLLSIHPRIEELIFCELFTKIVKSLNKNFEIEKATYVETLESFSKPFEQKQDNINIIICLSPFEDKFGGLKLFPGSQKQLLSKENINLVVNNNLAAKPNLEKTGLIVFNGKLIHQFYKTTNRGKLRYITITFKN